MLHPLNKAKSAPMQSPNTGPQADAASYTGHEHGNETAVGLPLFLQRAPLSVSHPTDADEIEAERVAGEVMRMPHSSGQTLHRCACGGIAGPDGECAACRAKRLGLQRKSDSSGGMTAPPSVHQTLRSSGQPLDTGTRRFMESRFGQDFSAVRIHTDSHAAQSAAEVNARAYTVGNMVVFGAGQYEPDTGAGQKLIAHELTHTIQQYNGVNQIVARADPQAPLATQLTMNLGRIGRTGIQFSPTNVTDSQVGPVTVQGGLTSAAASRLNVIIGENLTVRTLARQILPLYLTATPFTPTGAVAPLPLVRITEDELAQALMVYNQYFLPVTTMANWRIGLRFPLPIEVNEGTGMATLNPSVIQTMAGGFDPAWTPFLDQPAAAAVTPPAAVLQADVAAFLAREVNALNRGVHLSARALTNAVTELPFVRETFRQLGAGAFDVALAFMDNLVNREIMALAVQRDGAAILAEIRAALGAPPVAISPDQQTRLNRANLMLGLVAGVAAVAPPTARSNRVEKNLTVDTVKLDGSTHNPPVDLAIANAIFAQCNVRLVLGVNRNATPVETTLWLGGNMDLQAAPSCGISTTEERRLFQQATVTYGLGARIRAFYPATFSGFAARGYSVHPACATGTAAIIRNMVVVQNTGTTRTLAHEIGHILLNSAAHPGGVTNVMAPTAVAPLAETFTPAQCTTIYNNV